jgi:hypothetical protein
MKAAPPPKTKKAAELWRCPNCGVETEFACGHVMAGCEPVAAKETHADPR